MSTHQEHTEKRLIANTILRLNSVDSTNTYAKNLVTQGAREGTVVLADEQTAGKGRLGRTWISEPGANLTFSVILHPKGSLSQFGLISLLAGVAVAQAICLSTNLTAMCKWPNDVLVNGKKICGILSEAVSMPNNTPAIIVGIGINVNQTTFPDELKNTASSLSIENGTMVERESLLQKVFLELEYWYIQFQEQKYPAIITAWKEHSEMIGKAIALNQNGTIIKGKCVDIGENGALALEHDGIVQHYVAGDVTIVK